MYWLEALEGSGRKWGEMFDKLFDRKKSEPAHTASGAAGPWIIKSW